MKEIVKKIVALYLKYKEMILYLFFGGCTTVINTVVYIVLYEYMGAANFISTIIAWLLAVIFAFATNRNIVFASKRTDLKGRAIEFLSFFGCRFMTGILDVSIMVVAVDWMRWNALIWKIVSNVLVIIINYIASKFFIFRGDVNEKRL